MTENKCAICKNKFKKGDKIYKKMFDDEGMEYKKQQIICKKCYEDTESLLKKQ